MHLTIASPKSAGKFHVHSWYQPNSRGPEDVVHHGGWCYHRFRHLPRHRPNDPSSAFGNLWTTEIVSRVFFDILPLTNTYCTQPERCYAHYFTDVRRVLWEYERLTFMSGGVR